MKRWYLLLLTVFFISLSGCAAFDVTYLDERETIKYADSSWYTTAIVTNSGDCYVKGDISTANNYGLKSIPPSLLLQNRYMRIYNGGDAVNITISASGGCIVTDTNDVYAFCNDSVEYKTPTYLCSGYEQAYLGNDSRIYLLSDKGELGYTNLDSPDYFVEIGKSIKDFIIAFKDNKSPTILALTENEKLYILDCDEEINKSTNYIDNVTDFDLVVPHSKLCVLSILTRERDVLCRMGDYSLNYEGIMEDDFIKIGENITSVTSYAKGVAMLDEQKNVSLYGYGFKSGSNDGEFFSGEIVFTDVQSVFGGDFCLIVVWNDGTFTYYGKDSYTTEYHRITHSELSK